MMDEVEEREDASIDDAVSANKLSKIYLKIRDAREKLSQDYAVADKELQEQLELVESQLLDICKRVGAESIKTPAGTVMRRVATRYWTNDWETMHNFIKENDAVGLLERRISQTNMKQFLEENPDLFPPGMLIDSTYKITVRRSKQ
jgi:predicted HicB family RNase H-like nuclease